MKRPSFYSILIIGFCVLALSGCSTLNEWSKGVLGVSTQVLEDGKKNAIRKDFNSDYDTCYKRVMDSLGKIHAYIYANRPDKNLIAIYVTEEDTTPVGIFLEPVDKDNTTIAISSPSTYARETIAKKIFLGMEGKLEAEKKEDEPKKALFE
jgi:hypothetical protein